MIRPRISRRTFRDAGWFLAGVITAADVFLAGISIAYSEYRASSVNLRILNNIRLIEQYRDSMRDTFHVYPDTRAMIEGMIRGRKQDNDLICYTANSLVGRLGCKLVSKRLYSGYFNPK